MGTKDKVVPTVPVQFSRGTAYRFTDLLCDSEKSATAILKEHPELPSMKVLLRWRERYPAFARAWKRAREIQAEHLMQKCFDLADTATKENAHAVRVKFDIYKFYASKILPTIYGDKPVENRVSVSTAVVISPERLDALRSNLERARAQVGESIGHTKRLEERKTLLPESLIQHDKQSGNGKTPRKASRGEHSEKPIRGGIPERLPLSNP